MTHDKPIARRGRVAPIVFAAIAAVMLATAVTAAAWHTKIAAPPALPEPEVLPAAPGSGMGGTLNLDHPDTMGIVNVTVHPNDAAAFEETVIRWAERQGGGVIETTQLTENRRFVRLYVNAAALHETDHLRSPMISNKLTDGYRSWATHEAANSHRRHAAELVIHGVAIRRQKPSTANSALMGSAIMAAVLAATCSLVTARPRRNSAALAMTATPQGSREEPT